MKRSFDLDEFDFTKIKNVKPKRRKADKGTKLKVKDLDEIVPLQQDIVQNYVHNVVKPVQMDDDSYRAMLHHQNRVNQGVIRDADAKGYNPKDSKEAIALQQQLEQQGKAKFTENTLRGINALLSAGNPSTIYNLFHLGKPVEGTKALLMDFLPMFTPSPAGKGKLMSRFSKRIATKANRPVETAAHNVHSIVETNLPFDDVSYTARMTNDEILQAVESRLNPFIESLDPSRVDVEAVRNELLNYTIHPTANTERLLDLSRLTHLDDATIIQDKSDNIINYYNTNPNIFRSSERTITQPQVTTPIQRSTTSLPPDYIKVYAKGVNRPLDFEQHFAKRGTPTIDLPIDYFSRTELQHIGEFYEGTRAIEELTPYEQAGIFAFQSFDTHGRTFHEITKGFTQPTIGLQRYASKRGDIHDLAYFGMTPEKAIAKSAQDFAGLTQGNVVDLAHDAAISLDSAPMLYATMARKAKQGIGHVEPLMLGKRPLYFRLNYFGGTSNKRLETLSGFTKKQIHTANQAFIDKRLGLTDRSLETIYGLEGLSKPPILFDNTYYYLPAVRYVRRNGGSLTPSYRLYTNRLAN